MYIFDSILKADTLNVYVTLSQADIENTSFKIVTKVSMFYMLETKLVYVPLEAILARVRAKRVEEMPAGVKEKFIEEMLPELG